MSDQAQIKNRMELPNWLERNKKRAFGWGVVAFGIIVILMTVAAGGTHPKVKSGATATTNAAFPAGSDDVKHLQDEVKQAAARAEEAQRKAQEMAAQARANSALLAAGSVPGGPQASPAGAAPGMPVAYQTSSNTAAASAQAQHQDGGFLIVSADGKNSGVPVATQQTQDIQKLIDQEKEALKKSLEADPVTQAVPPQKPAGVTTVNPDADKKKADDDGLPPGERYQASEGKLIPCILMNRIQGEYSGPVKAVVANDVYSDDLKHKLIPRGALLIGEAAAVSNSQQKRISASFHRIEFPAGQYSVDLDKFTGLDQAGATALGGKVNTHLLSALLWSLPIGAVSGLSMSTTNLGYGMSGLDAYRMGVSQSTGQTANQILSRKTMVLPTITIPEGSRIEVWVAHDLKLPEYHDVR